MGDSELLNYLFFIIFSKHISEPAHLVFITVRKNHICGLGGTRRCSLPISLEQVLPS